MSRKNISKKIRFEVFKRDSFTCQYCGDEAPRAVLHVDHINPVAAGGGNEIVNLVTSCSQCNLGKGARKLSDDAAVKRQKQQIDELQSRKEQLEMMSDWRSGLADIAEKELAILLDEIHEIISPHILSEDWHPKLKRILKKHGLSEVVKAVDHSSDYYLRNGAHEQAVVRMLQNIPKSIKYINDPEEQHLARYINGIFRNTLRLDHSEQKELKADLIEFHKHGGDLKKLREAAKGADEDDLNELWHEVQVFITQSSLQGA